MDQEKEANPIAEIFDEMFTLLEDLETRSVAILEYLKEQGGVTDEKLAPYLDQAAAASNVRWRAGRARMEHLLAPKPKSTTETGKDEKAKPGAQPQTKGKESESGGTKAQGEKDQGAKSESKEVGKELASTQGATVKSGEGKDGKSQNVTPAGDAKAQQKEQSNPKQDKDAKKGKEADGNSGDAEAHASGLAGENKSEPDKSENGNKPTSPADPSKSTTRSSDEVKQQSQKAAK